MGCFSTACFGTWKHKQTFKKVHDQPLLPSNELHEAVTLLGATNKSFEEEIIVNPTPQPALEFDRAKSDEEQMSCKTGTISNCDKSMEKECVALNSKQGALDDNNPKGDCFSEMEAESSESLFSSSIDSMKQVFSADMGDKEVTSPLMPNNNNTSICSTKSVRLVDELSSFKFDENNKENVVLEPLHKQSLVKTAIDTTDTTTTASLLGWLNLSKKPNIGKSNPNSPESEKKLWTTGNGPSSGLSCRDFTRCLGKVTE